MRWFFAVLVLAIAKLAVAAPVTGAVDALRAYHDRLDEAVVDHYADPDAPLASLQLPEALRSAFDPAFTTALQRQIDAPDDASTRIGAIRGELQQAVTVQMADAVRRGDLEAAKAWRCELSLPRGVSAAEGSLLLATLGADPAKRDQAAQILTREAITWQTTRVRQLLAEIAASAREKQPMPGRLRERLGEAVALADLPPWLVRSAGLTAYQPMDLAALNPQIHQVESTDWSALAAAYAPLRHRIESSLPSLLTDQERSRRERLLLKLVMLIPREYSSGVRGGKVSVPLEYREAVAFTAQARQMLGELAPFWLNAGDTQRAGLDHLEQHLADADEKITAVAPADDLEATLKKAQNALTDELGISLARRGTTADIVDEVMLETRSLLSQSLSAALAGDWKLAEQHRLEAYTTYDPELEARLMPRDPQLATDIEHLLLDGLHEPGVKVLLDQRAPQPQLEAAYARVSDALSHAAAQLKSGISPSAAVINAASIVLREGLEGLLVIIAIFAGLRGPEHARRRRLFWVGILASAAATALTWLLSQTLITSLRNYGEVIEALTGLIAIGVLLLITNWLFHQVYWKQWITSLKSQAADNESAWALITVGFAVGYREGFETVLFLQSLVLDAGGPSVGAGVCIGLVILIALGVASLKLGLKLPYFKLLMLTALLIGLVLITFTGTTVRAMQTVGWIPVHKLMDASWPLWTGNWLGLYNTWESLAGQAVAAILVIGTWRIARFKAKRKSAHRRATAAACRLETATDSHVTCGTDGCAMDCDPAPPVQLSLPPRANPQPLPASTSP